jgi:hypothetical protein
MRKALSAALLICMVTILSASLMPTVLAKKSEYVTGKWTYMAHMIPPVPAKIVGDNVFLNTWEDGIWSGGIAGVSIDDPCHIMIHGTNVWPPPSFDYRLFTAISTIKDCTVDGKTGGLVIFCAGKAEFGKEWHGAWVILSGTGGLKGIHGQGTWWGMGAPGPEAWGFVEYQGWIR